MTHYFCSYAADCDATIDDYKTYCEMVTRVPNIMLAEAFVSKKQGKDASELINYFRNSKDKAVFYLAGCFFDYTI